MSLWTGYPAGTGSLRIRLENEKPGDDKIILKCLARSDDFQRKLSTKFILSDKLLNTNLLSQSSALLQLPSEILSLIFTHLLCAPSQIALALTCKSFATLTSTLPLALSTTSRKYAGFLPVSVFDVPLLMTSLKPWIPHLRLCNHCLTFRPRPDTSQQVDQYWSRVQGCEVSNFWIVKTGWTFGAGSWHKIVHDICPACHGSCSLSDYVDCDGCRALGRLGDVDWARVGDHWRRRTEEELRGGWYAT